MRRTRGKVEIEDVRLGEGEAATRKDAARIACKISLHHGDCVQELTDYWIDLKRRHVIAGLRYGVEGMRVGGIRRVTIPPHLAYGDAGVGIVGVPPNALLICEVELLELQATELG